ncbi:MAG TPA: hypothetical protein VK942_02200, partial [Actinomycetes bacterium]|nr:hypothetical protein [Actinomycetes bacterium]
PKAVVEPFSRSADTGRSVAWTVHAASPAHQEPRAAARGSWCAGDAAWIVQATGLPVSADLESGFDHGLRNLGGKLPRG